MNPTHELEFSALFDVIDRCAQTGKPGKVLDSEGLIAWRVEPDTKVDERDATYPVIVHAGHRP